MAPLTPRPGMRCTSITYPSHSAPPGDGPRLHRHAYEEIFIILEGHPRFTVGSQTLDARPGQVIIVRPHVAHKFVNVGTGWLRQIDIHASPSFRTEWLE